MYIAEVRLHFLLFYRSAEKQMGSKMADKTIKFRFLVNAYPTMSDTAMSDLPVLILAAICIETHRKTFLKILLNSSET